MIRLLEVLNATCMSHHRYTDSIEFIGCDGTVGRTVSDATHTLVPGADRYIVHVVAVLLNPLVFHTSVEE